MSTVEVRPKGSSSASFGDPKQVDSQRQQIERLVAPPHHGDRIGTARENIEAAIKHLAVREQLFIDTDGNCVEEKSDFVRNKRTALATIERTGPDSFIVYSGMPPANTTYCGTMASTGSGQNRLKYGMILNSGDTITLTSAKYRVITIPHVSSERSDNDRFPITIEEKIAKAAVGDRLVLGRNDDEVGLPAQVSRAHITVDILEKIPQFDGSFNLSVRVYPGMLGATPISINSGNGELQPVYGRKAASGGATVFLGPDLAIELPHSAESVQGSAMALREQLRTPRSNLGDHRLMSVFGGQGAFTLQNIDSDRIGSNHEEQSRTVLGNLLERHIVAGLELIKAQQFDEAHKHFANSVILEQLGYTFHENHLYVINSLDPGDLIEYLDRIAGDSWFKVKQKMVYPSCGLIDPNLVPTTDEQKELVRQWKKEAVLLFAEEYTHALQDWYGKNVSRKGILLPGNWHEGDVAVFFIEQGVMLSTEFVDRYKDERMIAQQIAKGVETADDRNKFAAAISSAGVGRPLLVGRTLRDGEDRAKVFGFASDKGNIPRQACLDTLNPVECSITLMQDGSYRIAPFGIEKCSVFVPDGSGYYHRLKETERLEPGTTIYLGKGLKFSL